MIASIVFGFLCSALIGGVIGSKLSMPLVITAQTVPLAAIQPARSKQTIIELQDETGKFLTIIQKDGVPLLQQWRTQLTTKNPELVCLDENVGEIINNVSVLEDKAKEADSAFKAIYEQNKIDSREFNRLFSTSGGFEYAITGLGNYKAGLVRIFMGNPTCESVIKNGNLPSEYALMIRSIDQFSIWIANSQDALNNYREALRKEMRDTP